MAEYARGARYQCVSILLFLPLADRLQCCVKLYVHAIDWTVLVRYVTSFIERAAVGAVYAQAKQWRSRGFTGRCRVFLSHRQLLHNK